MQTFLKMNRFHRKKEHQNFNTSKQKKNKPFSCKNLHIMCEGKTLKNNKHAVQQAGEFALEMPKRASEIIQKHAFEGYIKTGNRPRNDCGVITNFSLIFR